MLKEVAVGDLKPGDKFRFAKDGGVYTAEGFKPGPTTFHYRVRDSGGDFDAGPSWAASRTVYVEEETVTITLTKKDAQWVRDSIVPNHPLSGWRNVRKVVAAALECECK